MIWKGLLGRESRLILALTGMGVAGTAITSTTWAPLRAILVLPFVVFVPGYALTIAIFRRRRPPLVERTVLALSLSLVIAALASLVLHLTPYGLTLRAWVASLVVITAAATFVGTTGGAGTEEPVLARLAALLPRSKGQIAMLVLAAGLVAAAVALARTPLPSPSAPGYTALWLSPDPHSAGLTLGVRSEEHHRTRYVLRFTVAGRRTTRRFALAPGQTRQETLPPAQKASASLFRVGRRGVYRSVRLTQGSQTGR